MFLNHELFRLVCLSPRNAGNAGILGCLSTIRAQCRVHSSSSRSQSPFGKNLNFGALLLALRRRIDRREQAEPSRGIIANVSEIFERIEHGLLASLQIVLVIAARIVDGHLQGHARFLPDVINRFDMCARRDFMMIASYPKQLHKGGSQQPP